MTADPSPTGSRPTDDLGSVQQAIETFESILEAFPEDVSALQSLCAAYEQAGDIVKVREISMRLAHLLSQQGDWEKVYDCALRILEIDPADEEAIRLRDHASNMFSASAPAGAKVRKARPGEATAQPSRPADLDFDLSGELDLAWFLLQHEMITQEQYEAAIAGLTESRMKPGSNASLSLLQELAGMERIPMEKIIAFLSAETSTPYIDVSRFEITEEVYRLIPLDKIRRLGILPFERVGGEVMIGTLNPVDENVRKAVAAYLDTKIHVFLCAPDEFQKAVQEISDRLRTT